MAMMLIVKYGRRPSVGRQISLKIRKLVLACREMVNIYFGAQSRASAAAAFAFNLQKVIFPAMIRWCDEDS